MDIANAGGGGLFLFFFSAEHRSRFPESSKRTFETNFMIIRNTLLVDRDESAVAIANSHSCKNTSYFGFDFSDFDHYTIGYTCTTKTFIVHRSLFGVFFHTRMAVGTRYITAVVLRGGVTFVFVCSETLIVQLYYTQSIRTFFFPRSHHTAVHNRNLKSYIYGHA